MQNSDEVVEIVGMITPGRWSNNGQVVEVNISLPTREVLVVLMNTSIADELLALIWRRVSLRGKVLPMTMGTKGISPYSFRVLS